LYFPLPELITGGLLGDDYIGHHKRCKDAYLYVEQKDLELVLHLWEWPGAEGWPPPSVGVEATTSSI